MRRLNLLSLHLIDNCADINRLDRDGVSPLMRAVSARNYPLVKALLARGADPNQKSRCKDAAQKFHIHDPVIAFAVGDKRKLRIIRLLLRYGADVNAYWGNGLITLAIVDGDPLLVDFYLKNGGKIERPYRRFNYFSWSLEFKSERVIELLSLAAPDINVVGLEGETPLMEIRWRSPKLVQHLLSLGANVNATDRYGQTTLMLYMADADISLIKLLLEASPDVNAVDSEGKTALDYAEQRWKGKEEIHALLQSYGARNGAAEVMDEVI
jgi:ankyrin repeat protein